MIISKIPPPKNQNHRDSDDRHNRIEWIDTLKVLTMFLVIMGHCNYYSIQTAFGGIDYIPVTNSTESLTYQALGFLTHIIYKFR